MPGTEIPSLPLPSGKVERLPEILPQTLDLHHPNLLTMESQPGGTVDINLSMAGVFGSVQQSQGLVPQGERQV